MAEAAGGESSPPFAVHAGALEVVVSSRGAAYDVRLVGELDLDTAGLLRDELARVADNGATLVTLDLADLGFIDSTGLSVLITTLKRLREKEGDMILRSPTPATRKVLEITGLTELFSIT
jgi:anti-anti-sigma factor